MNRRNFMLGLAALGLSSAKAKAHAAELRGDVSSDDWVATPHFGRFEQSFWGITPVMEAVYPVRMELGKAYCPVCDEAVFPRGPRWWSPLEGYPKHASSRFGDRKADVFIDADRTIKHLRAYEAMAGSPGWVIEGFANENGGTTVCLNCGRKPLQRLAEYDDVRLEWHVPIERIGPGDWRD